MLDANRVIFIEIIYKDKKSKIIKMIDDKISLTELIDIKYNLKVKKIKYYKCYEVLE